MDGSASRAQASAGKRRLDRDDAECEPPESWEGVREELRPEVPVGQIHLARVYDHEGDVPGHAFFVERLWPRGVRREDLSAVWLKDAAPSPELRRWYSHDVAKWEEFRRRYEVELESHPEAWQQIADAAATGDVTLLYAARDREHNSAVVLRDHVLAHLAQR